MVQIVETIWAEEDSIPNHLDLDQTGKIWQVLGWLGVHLVVLWEVGLNSIPLSLNQNSLSEAICSEEKSMGTKLQAMEQIGAQISLEVSVSMGSKRKEFQRKHLVLE